MEVTSLLGGSKLSVSVGVCKEIPGSKFTAIFLCGVMSHAKPKFMLVYTRPTHYKTSLHEAFTLVYTRPVYYITMYL